MTPAQRAIIEDVARRHNLTMADMLGKSQERRVARPRQEAMWMLRQTGRWSLPQIGRALGNRDHTTIRFGIIKYAERNPEAQPDLAAWRALGGTAEPSTTKVCASTGYAREVGA